MLEPSGASLSIVSLLPSATEIVGALGLGEHLVGVTHECDVCPDADGMRRLEAAGLRRVTTSHIDPAVLSQGEIDTAVKHSMTHRVALYTVDEEALRVTRPTVVLTQALCAVCAPAYKDVVQVCERLNALVRPDDAGTCDVINLEPEDLNSVGETFETIANACGVASRGTALRAAFERKLARLREAVAAASNPTMVLLEWLDPPFDGGHWVPGQIAAAGARPLLNAVGGKSKERSWAAVAEADPDVVVVACCGFDLFRNLADARLAAPLRELRAFKEGRVFALDGNRYFARPSPSLAEGAALLARCAHDGDPSVVSRLEHLGFLPREGKGWARL